jgi:hypothetical protein
MQRFLGFSAGPFRLATPIAAVRQIVEHTDVAGPPAIAIAALLGAEPRGPPAALLEFDALGAMRWGCCALRGVIDAPPPLPLPATVACRWPGLLAGTIDDGDDLTLVIDPRVLVGLWESTTATTPRTTASADMITTGDVPAERS